jgi:uncharacterized protein
MRDFRDAKAMAQTLREALKAKSVSLTHAESLELVAKALGFHDWNVLSARIQFEHRTAVTEPAIPPPPITAGTRLPTVPLRDIVLFPKMIVPIFMRRESSKRAVERAMAFDRRILAVTQRRAADDNPSQQGLYQMGVAASVINQTMLDDGTVRLRVEGLERATIVQLADSETPREQRTATAGQITMHWRYLTAEVAPVEETHGQEAYAFDLSRSVLEEFPAYRNASLSEWPYSRLPQIREPGELADAVVPFLTVGIDRRQDLLQTGDVISRLEQILALMKADRQAA